MTIEMGYRAWDNAPSASLEACTWKDVRNDVWKVNPEFAAVVDHIDPGKEYGIYKVKYPYGSEILRNGGLYIPNSSGQLVPLNDSSIDSRLQECLGYNLGSNPVTLVLENSLELFATLEDRVVPLYGVMKPGKIFGFWRVLNPMLSHQAEFIWDMTAGARSIFMLPKISEAEKHNKLRKEFQVGADVPRSLLDHWKIFREIANHEKFYEPWDVSLIFFSRNWFENLDDSAWCHFNYYLYRYAWIGSEFWRNNFFWDLMFSIIQKVRDIRPSPYISDTVKYLLAIGVGAVPGFAPAIDNSVAPISNLQRAYLEVYNLKEYAPIIMQPCFFSASEKSYRPVYYSLPFPNAIDFSLKNRTRTSLITDLYEVMSLLSKYVSELASGKLNIKSTPLDQLIKSVSYEFFHNNVENYRGMIESYEMPKEDNTFLEILDVCRGKKFPEMSTFVKGCVRITRKK